MPTLATPTNSIAACHVHRKHGVSTAIFAAYGLVISFVAHWMWTTVGEPYRVAVEQNEHIQVTNMLLVGTEERNVLKLQTGLMRGSELATFNESLFDSSKALLRAVRKRKEQLDEAVAGNEAAALVAALDTAIDLHEDGRPFVDRAHLRAGPIREGRRTANGPHF